MGRQPDQRLPQCHLPDALRRQPARSLRLARPQTVHRHKRQFRQVRRGLASPPRSGVAQHPPSGAIRLQPHGDYPGHLRRIHLYLPRNAHPPDGHTRRLLHALRAVLHAAYEYPLCAVLVVDAPRLRGYGLPLTQCHFRQRRLPAEQPRVWYEQRTPCAGTDRERRSHHNLLYPHRQT